MRYTIKATLSGDNVTFVIEDDAFQRVRVVSLERVPELLEICKCNMELEGEFKFDTLYITSEDNWLKMLGFATLFGGKNPDYGVITMFYTPGTRGVVVEVKDIGDWVVNERTQEKLLSEIANLCGSSLVMRSAIPYDVEIEKIKEIVLLLETKAQRGTELKIVK